MILAQNRLLQLSGNKVIIFFLMGLFFMTSCGTSKRVTKRPSHKTSTVKKPSHKKKKNVKVVKKEWKEVNKSTVIRKKNDNSNTTTTTPSTVPGVNRKDAYTVSLIMPFKGNSVYREGNDHRLTSYINYYAGIKMALHELSNKGANFNFKVYDEDKDFNSLINSTELAQSDIIIGPRKKDKLKKVVNLGKQNEILVVSPWWTSSKMTTNNPYYLQLNPSTTDRYETLLRHAKKHFRNENIIVIERENKKDKKRSSFFQRLNTSIDGSNSKPIEIFTVNVDSINVGDTAFDELFMLEDTRRLALIVPNWSSKDENYLYSCLRKLSVEKGTNNLTIYTMSKALDSELIGFELYKSLNMHIAAEKYIKPEDESVKRFRRKYFEVYNDLATDEAVEGYDMMSFVGNNLIKYGNTFPAQLHQPERMSQIKYDIQVKNSKKDISNEKYDNPQYYQNKHVDIIKFSGFRFERD